QQGFGLRDLERNEEITPQTNFRMASVSKPFTAMAIAMLEEQGRLHPDMYVNEILEGFPDVGRQIRIRHLIHHTSGLPEYCDELCSDVTHPRVLSNRDVYDYIKTKNSLEFEPGSRFCYNNTGYNLLALVLENVCGLSYPELITSMLLKPAGMEASRVVTSPSQAIPERALGYSDWPFFDLHDDNPGNYLHGDDGIYTSVTDIARWFTALDQYQFVSEATYARMASGAQLDDGEPIHYGYGLVRDILRGQEILGHGGSWMGFNTEIAHLPSLQLWIAVFANSTSISAWRLMLEVAKSHINAAHAD